MARTSPIITSFTIMRHHARNSPIVFFSVAGTEVVDEPPVIDTEEDSAPIARSAKRGKHLELSPIAIMPKLRWRPSSSHLTHSEPH